MKRTLLAILFLLLLLPAQAQIDINHYLREGYADLNKSNYTSAINRFNTIIQVKPEMLEPYYFRGFCKLRLDDYQGAYADFQRFAAASHSAARSVSHPSCDGSCASEP